MIIPPFLKKGDTIAIVAPAKAINEEALQFAVKLFEAKGYRVKLGKYVREALHNMAGTDAQRLHDMNWSIHDDEVKAIIAFRGGYGSIRIIDEVDLAHLKQQPKWLVGFSDITVFHNALYNLRIASLHATMPINYETNTPEAMDSLFNALEGNPNSYTLPPHEKNVRGKAKGEVIGGNLAILASLIGTNYDVDYSGKLLFIEDLSEYLYRLDRVFWSLKHAGKLQQFAGLMVGGFTQMQDGDIPYGKTAEDIIHEHTKDLGIPVCFGFPVGHFEDNRALKVGIEAELSVSENSVAFTQP